MSWIALRSAAEAVLNPAGLGLAMPEQPVNPDHVLPRGSLMVQFSFAPQIQPANLIRYAARDPWPAGLTLCIDQDGLLRLLLRQGNSAQSWDLPTGIKNPGEVVLVTYVWDAPARTGVLAAYLPDQDQLFQIDITAPVPPNLRDLGRMVAEGQGCTLAAEVAFLAIADHLVPVGPLPGFNGQVQVATPEGPVAISRIRCGDLVDTVDGDPARVVWSGAVTLPARGRFAPLLLRAPYHGLAADFVVRPDQRLYLTGSDIEYLFGQEDVLAAIRHLEDGRSVLRQPEMAVVSYHQLVLDRHAIIRVNGAALESLDISSILADPSSLRHSVVAQVPPALLPRGPGLPQPVLRDFEAMTWRRQRAA